MNYSSHDKPGAGGVNRSRDQQGGEDEGSTSKDGHDEHLRDDQKPINPAPASSGKRDVSRDDGAGKGKPDATR